MQLLRGGGLVNVEHLQEPRFVTILVIRDNCVLGSVKRQSNAQHLAGWGDPGKLWDELMSL
jgi:hypothetical protein